MSQAVAGERSLGRVLEEHRHRRVQVTLLVYVLSRAVRVLKNVIKHDISFIRFLEDELVLSLWKLGF